MKERLEYYAHLTVCAVGALLASYLVIKYVLSIILPFVIAWCVAEGVKPIAKLISRRTVFRERWVSAALCVIIVICILAALVGGVSYALSEAWSLLRALASSGEIENILDKLLSVFPEGDGGELGKYAKDALESALSGLLSSVGGAVSSLAGGLPRVLLFVLVTVAAAFYFSLDIERINKFFLDIMPKSLHGWLFKNKRNITGSFLKYLRAYAFLMLITAAEMLVGFLVIGIDYAVLLAIVVSILDALPLIGVGVILVPMAIYNFLIGESSRAVGILILFLIHTVLRQVTEPRIIGKNLGIHPIVSLSLVYFGYRLFGAVGLLLVPVFSVLINAILNKDDAPEVTERTVGK